MIDLDKKEYQGINYDLEKLFINLDLEEIQGIIYQASIRGVTKDNMINEVISKISLTLPQDIILCLKLNGYQTKKDHDLFDKIIEGYKKGEHYNFQRFLKTMTKTKNIIYTFSGNLERIKIYDELETDKFGKLTPKEIKDIRISSFKSENSFEEEIDKFLNEAYKVCLIRFNSSEGNFINYVKYFIENKEKEFISNNEDKNNIKIFIFIVHLTRVYDYELKDPDKKTKKEQKIINKKILKETISNLSEYYQIFIDNLNGMEDIKIDPIFRCEGLEIFENFLNFRKELEKNIYRILSYMKLNIPFSYEELNEENYTQKLIEYICNKENEDIRKSFNECIKRQIGQKDNQNDLIKEMFKKEGRVKYNDKDVVSIIHEELSTEYANYLTQFYYKAEKDNFFATLLSNEEDKNMNGQINENILLFENKTKEKYFSEFKIEKENKILQKQGQNPINIYFGLKIPKIMTTLKKLINFIKEENEKKYHKN